jgi:hypothetical protein
MDHEKRTHVIEGRGYRFRLIHIAFILEYHCSTITATAGAYGDGYLSQCTCPPASAPSANDGFLKLWIDDALVETLSGVDATTSGTMYFDNFESRRDSYIGP